MTMRSVPTLADVKSVLREIVTITADAPEPCDQWPNRDDEDGHWCVGCTIGELAQGALMLVEDIEVGRERGMGGAGDH